jgi:hypothetical protein
MQNYDLLGQGSTQLITGWSNGKIDCRSTKTGEVLFKDTMTAGVAGVVEGDYRSVGKTDVICASSEGEGIFAVFEDQISLEKFEVIPLRSHCLHLLEQGWSKIL